jgi:predicted peptidase
MSNQQAHSFQWSDPTTYTLRYLFYLPREYGANQQERWPLVLFLHGRGERGDDLERVTIYGPPKLIKEGQEFPFILVSPQCPRDDRWDSRSCKSILGALLDEIEGQYAVDPDRIYVTGLSMGGYGTWALAIANPQRFAAIVPICGGGDPEQVCAIKHVPVWAFHGSKDPVVPLQRTQEMVDTLKGCGGNVRLTVYPEARHDSWTETYANPQLYTWLLAQRRNAQ